MLAIVHKGIAIPIFWILLNKRGNSDTTERIALIKRFIRIFGQDKIESLVADREFIGKTWFEWLNQNKITFHCILYVGIAFNCSKQCTKTFGGCQ